MYLIISVYSIQGQIAYPITNKISITIYKILFEINYH